MGSQGMTSRGAYAGRLPSSRGDEEWQILLPDDWKRDRSKRPIIHLHGAGGSYRQGGSGSTGSTFGALLEPAADQLRYPVVSIDAGSNGGALISGGSGTGAVIGGQDTFGNAVAMTALGNAITWATTASSNPSGFQYLDTVPGGAAGPVLLIGYSMGALIALNYAARFPANVRAMLLVAPPVNLDDVYTSGRGSYTAKIDDAYQGPKAQGQTPTITGTAGAIQYNYMHSPLTTMGKGIPSNASANFSGPVQANLGSTPNTVNMPYGNVTAALSLLQQATGIEVLRSVSGGAFTLIDTVGVTFLTAQGTGTVTTLTVSALPFAIPAGTQMTLYHPDGVSTTVVTLSAGAAANATSLAINSVTFSQGYPAQGTLCVPTQYPDKITGAGSAYTALTSSWQTAGRDATVSYNPFTYLNLSQSGFASLKAIPCQVWWSANDGVVDAIGTPGTPTTNIAAYKALYGANCTLQELTGDPSHANAFSGFVAGASQQTALNFIAANA